MISPPDDFDKFFNPARIAIIGVSTGEYKFGGSSFLHKLLDCGFPGNIYPVNPKSGEIRGLTIYPDLISLPEVPDLAIICVAAGLVPPVLETCARIGLRHIHIMTSGFRETGLTGGRILEDRIVSLAQEHDLRVIGPNCMGAYCPASKLTAWGAIPGLSGAVGIISQSGGLTQRLTEYLASLGIGVSKAVSFGNAAVLDSTDFLEFMAADDAIRVIVMYIESVKDARRLLRIATTVNRDKPIILWKGGESSAGAATAVSHTGALAGSHKMWTTFCRQTGVTRVRSLNECADTVAAFSLLPRPAGNGIFIIGGGGGNSVTSGDAFNRLGFEVPPLSEDTMNFLRGSVPAAGSIAGNPLDMWRTFTDAAYLTEILELGYQDPAISIIVVDHLVARKAFHFAKSLDPTPRIIEFLEHRQPAKPTVLTIDTDGGDPDLAAAGIRLRSRFCKAGFPAYPSVGRAARALAHLYRYYKTTVDR